AARVSLAGAGAVFAEKASGGPRRKFGRTERRHWQMHGEDAASVAYLEGTRASEDSARRCQRRLECDRIFGGGHHSENTAGSEYRRAAPGQAIYGTTFHRD